MLMGGPQSIGIGYFYEHTFMGADSIHGLIGKRMWKTPKIATSLDMVDIVDNSAQSIISSSTDRIRLL